MLADSRDFCKNYRSTRLHRMGHPYAFMATLRTLCVSIYEGRSKALIDTSRTAVQQGHEPCQSFGRMAIWGHCELLCIPRLQQKLKNRLKSCWQNVHCVYQSTTSKFFGIDPPQTQDFNQVSEDKCNTLRPKFVTFGYNSIQLLTCS